MPPVPSPNDSAISVATTPQNISSSPPKSNSPRTPPIIIPYSALSAAQQAAQDLENDDAVQQAQDEIDIDSGADGRSISDAGYETDSLRSASTSIGSSVRDYAFENGRRYHRFREGAYNFPNDDSEQEREDMKHAMMVNLCQTLHFAPIGPNPQNVLDMGTGTGIWCIESEFLLLRMILRAGVDVNGSGRSVSRREYFGSGFKPYSTRMGSHECKVYGR